MAARSIFQPQRHYINVLIKDSTESCITPITLSTFCHALIGTNFEYAQLPSTLALGFARSFVYVFAHHLTSSSWSPGDVHAGDLKVS